MKKLWLLSVWCLAGCASAGLVYAPAAQGTLDSAKAVRISGEITPYETGFSGAYVYDGEAVSLAVVSDAGITLLNLRVTPDKTFVHYALSGLPKRVQAAFGRLARAAFFTACPKEEITYYDASLRARFEVRTQGAICP